MIEKTCVSRFVEKSQRSFAQGATFRDVVRTIPRQQAFVERVYGSATNGVLHRIAKSTGGLVVLVTYEFLRSKKVPLPNSNHVIGNILPAKNRSVALVGREQLPEEFHERMNLIDK